MKIIHYTLGLPPFRNGGLIKYSVDLAMEQSKENEVILLYPGEINKKKETKIKFKKNLKLIKVYSIINPLPIPVMFGIKNPKDFMKSVLTDKFEIFLKKEKPDVIHIHTLMGLHKEFIEVCNKLKIKTVFTTHDYFGICPKVNLLDQNLVSCNNYKDGEKCIDCNRNSFDTKIINKMNSKIYIWLRQNRLLNKFKGTLKSILYGLVKFKKKIILNRENIIKNSENNKNDYKKLREYYFSIFNLIDKFHFNSNISKKIYKSYLKDIVGSVIFITHKNIEKNINFHKEEKNENQIRVSFFGNENPVKGLKILLEGFTLLDKEEKEKIKISIYGVENGIIKNTEKNIEFKGKYIYKDLEKIFKNTDYTFIPSIWYETFNFVALESKLYKTPVIISETIGAKEIFESNEKIEIIINEINIKNVLKFIIKEEKLKIDKEFLYKTFKEHSREIYNEIYNNLK